MNEEIKKILEIERQVKSMFTKVSELNKRVTAAERENRRLREELRKIKG
jgi:regulator of replication initiation timing